MSQKVQKTAFQEFIEANEGLIDCYSKVAPEQYKKMNDQDQTKLCSTYKNSIKSLLDGNRLAMGNLLRERIEIVTRLSKDEFIKTNWPKTE